VQAAFDIQVGQKIEIPGVAIGYSNRFAGRLLMQRLRPELTKGTARFSGSPQLLSSVIEIT
jgi:hypothetical protein